MSFCNSQGEKIVVGLHSHLCDFGIAPRFDIAVPRYLRFTDVWVSLKPGIFYRWELDCEEISNCQHYFPALTKLAPALAGCQLKFSFGVNPRGFIYFPSFAAVLTYFDTQLLPLIQAEPTELKIAPKNCTNGEKMGEELIAPVLSLPRVMHLNAVEFNLPMIGIETGRCSNTLCIHCIPVDAIVNWLQFLPATHRASSSISQQTSANKRANIVNSTEEQTLCQHERRLSISFLFRVFCPSIMSDLEQLEERIKSVIF